MLTIKNLYERKWSSLELLTTLDNVKKGGGGGRAAENKNYRNLTFACLYSDSPLGSGALGPLCAVNS